MTNKRRGRLFVISASSGTGKTTLAKELLRKDRGLVQSVSYTTRQPRGKERHRKDYHFVSKKEFMRTRRENGFLEWANVFGRFYGTPKLGVERHLRRGRDVLMLIDVQGAKKVKKKRKDAVFIFLAPPSFDELKKRLKKRGTEDRKEINRRLKVAIRELKELNDPSLADYRIVNRDIPTCETILEAIIKAERNHS